MFSRIFIILFVLLFFSCDIDNLSNPQLPTWSMMIDVPLIKTNILLKDHILELDTSIIIYEDINTANEFDSLFLYKLNEPIDTTFINDKLSIQNVVDKTFSQSVDAISINNISINENVNFSDIGIQSVSSEVTTKIGTINLENIDPQNSEPYTLENLLGTLHGSIQTLLSNSSNSNIGNQPYDEGLLGTINGQNIDPTSNSTEFSSFLYANFNEGNLVINIDNSLMYLDFDNILIQLSDLTTNNILTSINIGQMLGGENISKIVNLNELPDNGYLPNLINFTISGSVSGLTTGATYNEILNSQIDITISANNLVVSEASAKVPEQSFNDTGNIILNSVNKISEATINTGYLNIVLDNNLPDELNGNINISIPNIIDGNSDALLFSFNLSETMSPINLNGYHIIFDNIDNQQIIYTYSVSTLSTNDFITINENDDIKINFQIIGNISDANQKITFASINGIIESQDQVISGEMELNIEGADIQNAILSSGEIELEIINNISNAPLDIEITISELTLNNTQFTKVILLTGSHNQIITLDNYTLTPSQNSTSPIITYNARATSSNQTQNQYDLEKNISINLSIQNINVKEVTGYFSQDPIIENNTIQLDDDNIIKTGTIEEGIMQITINNNLGVIADIDFQINEIIDDVGNPFSYTILLDGNVENIDISLANHTINLVDDSNSSSFQTISYSSEININSQEVITLNLEDNVDFSFTIPELTFSQIDGYIAPVEVEIEPFSKSNLNLLPDDIQNITFNRANGYLSFDSQLDLNLLLELNFYSKNTNSGEEFTFQIIENTSTSIQRLDLDSDKILQMINIIPDSISVSGKTSVSGDGVINKSDYIAGNFTIEVPFEFLFTEATSINVPSSKLPEDSIPDEFDNMTLFYEYETPFDFNTSLTIYCADDTNTIINEINKFLTIELSSSNNPKIDSIAITSNKFDLLNSSQYIKPVINLLSSSDDNGNLLPNTFYSTDSLSLKFWSKFKLIVNEN